MAENGGLTTYGGNVNTDDLTGHTKGNGKTAQPHNSDAANEWYYKKQEAEMNHRYALDAAAVENQYMLDQWNRENAYNDPSAVAERYRKAGINPRAAFGTGSASGAGIAAHSSTGDVGSGSASGSYGKSDISQGIENAGATLGMITDVAGQGVAIAKSIGGLTNMSADTTQKRVITEGLQIDNRYKEQKILSALTNERADTANKLKSTELKESERQFYEKRLAQIDQEIEESDQRIEESAQRIEQSKQDVNLSKAQERRVNEETRESKMANDLFESTGVRPGMNLQQALVSVGANLFGIAKPKVEEFIKNWSLNPDSTVTEKQVEEAAQILADEYNRLEDKNFKENDKDAYYRYKMRIWHNLALSFK